MPELRNFKGLEFRRLNSNILKDFSSILWTRPLEINQWKNFKNWSTFAENMIKVKCIFLSHSVEEASTHNSAKIQTGTFFCDSWSWYLTFLPQINEFQEFMVEHFCVEFGDPSCSGFWDNVQKNWQTDRQTDAQRQTNANENLPRRLPSVLIIIYDTTGRIYMSPNVDGSQLDLHHAKL